MSDSRDTNHDGKVSFVEKVKDALHLGPKDAGHASTHHAAATTTTGHSADLNHDGHVSAGERVAASAVGVQDEARLRLHEEQLAVAKHQVGAGEVDIHKRVHAERVQQSIPVTREEVTVEHRPLSGAPDPNARIAAQDEVLRVPLHREELVTEKRVVPTEEVIVRKKDVTEAQTVEATLRSEHVETRARETDTAHHHTHNEAHQHGAHGSAHHHGPLSPGQKRKGETALGSDYADRDAL